MVSFDKNLKEDQVLKYATDSILITSNDLDRPGPTIVYVNTAFEEMTGWMSGEIVGQSPRILQGPNTDLGIFKHMAEILKSGDVWQGQTINYRKDGSEFFMEWSISSIPNEKGRPEYYIAVQRDVTRRVQMERKLEETRHLAAEANRKRLNLSRYFSPLTAEHLAERDNPLGEIRKQKVAILFIDIVGSTTFAESMAPEKVVGMLRSFYQRMAKVIFTYQGSIEHFGGDSLLAVFGVPDVNSNDATNALLCSRQMLLELERWNEKRIRHGRQEIIADITAHYGDVVLGDIGIQESMSFTVIGDTVNTTSRLQELCRSLKKRLLVSEEILLQAKSENVDQCDQNSYDVITDFECVGSHEVRGKSQNVKLYSRT
ncbi:adenylate/guanylate cyclase domain-containing protein [Kiloniella antarctica]|uniref:Adenylate/guanylate cyclase domain-containing protein n=1 Tax=Kiloniella antarctica TaxID=1550907 RepID=A0ABW5BHW8_9PROT